MSWLPSGDQSSWVHATSWRPGSTIVRLPRLRDQTETLDGVPGLARQKAIRCPSGDHCEMPLPAGRGMCARIRPPRLITTTPCRGACCRGGVSASTRRANLLPRGSGSAYSRTGVADGQPSAPLSSAAVTMVRAARPGLRTSMALSGAVSGPYHSLMGDAADELTGPDTMAAGDCGSPTASVTVPSMRPFPPAAGMRVGTQDLLSQL